MTEKMQKNCSIESCITKSNFYKDKRNIKTLEKKIQMHQVPDPKFYYIITIQIFYLSFHITSICHIILSVKKFNTV